MSGGFETLAELVSHVDTKENREMGVGSGGRPNAWVGALLCIKVTCYLK
jgi:hypothetical protein